MNYFEVQGIAKNTIEFIKSEIRVGMNLRELRKIAEDKMLSLGATSFWYWNVGAFVFSGKDTLLSLSGKSYKTADKVIERDDIITIDLSPQVGNIWGDYARTIIIEGGVVVDEVEKVACREWKDGLLMEEKLHKELLTVATRETTFEELFFIINDIIKSKGYVNLDFMDNLGHSIETSKRKRIYIEKGNTATLESVPYFTFEPHIAIKGSEYGFKKEDIYYFENEKLKQL